MGCLIRTANGTYYTWLHLSRFCQISKAGCFYLLLLKQYLIIDGLVEAGLIVFGLSVIMIFSFYAPLSMSHSFTSFTASPCRNWQAWAKLRMSDSSTKWSIPSKEAATVGTDSAKKVG